MELNKNGVGTRGDRNSWKKTSDFPNLTAMVLTNFEVKPNHHHSLLLRNLHDGQIPLHNYKYRWISISINFHTRKITVPSVKCGNFGGCKKRKEHYFNNNNNNAMR